MQKRKPLIAGNWKMHGFKSQVRALVANIKQGATAYSEIDILLLPAFVHLQFVKELLSEPHILLGAQNLYLGTQGAFTGEISGPMIKDLGGEFVLVGHSERRMIFGENLKLVAEKFKAAIEAGLKPILCVGETRAQRESGETKKIIEEQIQTVLDLVGAPPFNEAVIAYEPVWAIGTGLTATPEQAQEMHADIRQLISQNDVDLAKTIRILYGGSMKADNAASLLAMPDIDGGLIGGASLEAESFLSICQAANREVAMLKTN